MSTLDAIDNTELNKSAKATAAPYRSKPRRWRRALMGLAVSSATFLLCCLIVEGGLRMVWQRVEQPTVMQGLEGAKYYQKDPELRFLPKPNISGVHAGFNAAFTTNERGLRGADSHFTVPKPPGIRRVVVLGDSFAWGYGVGDNEIFTEILESRLPDVEVVNLGAISFNLRDEFRYLKREGMRYEPDVVLLAICQNDIREHADPVDERVAKRLEQFTAHSAVAHAGVAAGLRPVKEFLRDHSYLYAFAQQTINSNKTLTRAAVRIGLKEEYAGFDKLDVSLHASLVEYPQQVERAMRQYRSDLLQLDAYLRQRNVQLLVVLIPALQSVNPQALDASIAYTVYDREDFDADKPYRLIEQLAVEHGIQVVNPLETVRGCAGRGEELYLPNDMHFNAAGHRVFADAIEPALARMLESVNHPKS